MHKLLLSILLVYISPFISAENLAPMSADNFFERPLSPACTTRPKQCTTTIELARGKPVTWSFTAQSPMSPGLKVSYKHPRTGREIFVVNTFVTSKDLNSRATGQFNPPFTGTYKVYFIGAGAVREDTAAIINNFGVAVITYQFATEDNVSGDFNDSFATISSFDKRG